MRFRVVTHLDVAPPFRACPERSEGAARAGLKLAPGESPRRSGATQFMLATGLVFALSAWAQQKPVAPVPPAGPAKPFTQDQMQGLVRDGLGDESGAKLIEQRGIDFTPRGILGRARKW